MSNREIMEQALENIDKAMPFPVGKQAITVLREALAQPEQAQRKWVGLTEEEIEAIGDKVANEELVGPVSNFRVRLARAIEQALKELNK